MTAAKSISTRRGALRSNEAYGELRRLTMRGLRRLWVRTACSVAAVSSTSWNQRRRRRGRCGGKGPRLGLSASQQVQVSGEGLLSVWQPMSRSALVQQPAHGVVRQDPAARHKGQVLSFA